MDVKASKQGIVATFSQSEYDLLVKALSVSYGHCMLSEDENGKIIQMIDDGVDYTSENLLAIDVKI